MPTVSILLPTYNREHFLPDAFAAIAAQTFTNWELIVVDDGSVDCTRDAVAKLTAKVTQPVRYIYQENQGAYGARNVALENATGEFMAFYDSDDLWLPHHLKNCVDALSDNPDVDWIYGACRIVDHTTGKELDPSTFYIAGAPRPFMKLHHQKREAMAVIEDPDATRCQIKHGLYCGLQNSVIRRRIFDAYRFDAESRNEAEDQNIVIRSLKLKRRFAWIDDVHVIYRIHGTNSSAAGGAGDLKRQERVLRLLAAGLEQLLTNVDWTSAERRALRQRLNEEYFWKLGYATLWMNGHRSEAMTMFRHGLRHWPWDWRCWKTYIPKRLVELVREKS